MSHAPVIFDTAQAILTWQSSSADPLTVGRAPLSPHVGSQDVQLLVGLDNGPWTYWSEFDANPQGGHRGNVYNFQYWQYVDAMYYYVHRLAAVPPAMWIDAAHRNGVKVYSAVTCDCVGCADEFTKLVQQSDEAAEQLYLIADTYGFDGWMFDVENGAEPDDNLQKTMQLLKARKLSNGRPIEVGFYQAYVYSIDEANYPFFEAGTFYQSDYTPERGCPEATYTFLDQNNAAGRRFDTFWAVNVYAFKHDSGGPGMLFNGYSHLDVQGCFDLLGQARTEPPTDYYQSLALYAPDWTMYGGHDATSDPLPDRETFHETDRKFWVGDGSGPAVSNFVDPRSSAVSMPFITRFNTGEGSVFSIFGMPMAGEWCHLGCQERLPTWLDRVTGSRAVVQAQITYEDAYDGGSALAFRGTLQPNEEVEFELFLTQFTVSSGAMIRLVYKLGPNSLLPYVKATFDDGTTYRTAGGTGGGWVRAVGHPSVEKTVMSLSVGFSNTSGADATVDVAVGELTVTAANFPPPDLITPTQNGDMLTWSPPSGWEPIWYYNVFRSAGGTTAFVGRAFLGQYDLLAALFRQPSGGTYVVQPVTTSGNASDVS